MQRTLLRVTFLFALTLRAFPLAAAEPEEDSQFARWEPAIAAFERSDAEQPPAPGGVLFVGSSSIRLWKLEESFPELGALNRGFGGSKISDALHFADRIILPYKPRIIVLYSGGNDLTARREPAEIAADFRKLSALLARELPETKLIYISLKPAPARWEMIDKIRETNRLIRESIEGDERRVFLDMEAAMLTAEGKPDPSLHIQDGLHLNAAGYAIWAKALEPHLNVEEKP